MITVQELSIGQAFIYKETIYEIMNKVLDNRTSVELYSWCRPIVTMWDGIVHYVHNPKECERINALAEVEPTEYLSLGESNGNLRLQCNTIN